MGVAGLGRPGLSAVRKKELGDRWKAGESLSERHRPGVGEAPQLYTRGT
jgi:hypothetical protein